MEQSKPVKNSPAHPGDCFKSSVQYVRVTFSHKQLLFLFSFSFFFCFFFEKQIEKSFHLLVRSLLACSSVRISFLSSRNSFFSCLNRWSKCLLSTFVTCTADACLNLLSHLLVIIYSLIHCLKLPLTESHNLIPIKYTLR